MTRLRWTIATLVAVAGLVLAAAVPGAAGTRKGDAREAGGANLAALAGPAACDQAGKQIEFIYGVPSGNGSSYATQAATIRSDAAAMQSWLKREAGPRRDQTFKFCTTGGVVAVTATTLPAVGSDNIIDSDEMKTALQQDGYNSPDRKYVVYLELTSSPEQVVGCGDRTSPGCTEGKVTDPTASTANRNNTGPAYGFVSMNRLGRLKTAMHELFHALGAVQSGAPGYSSTSSSHTKTAGDLMTGGPEQYHCDSGSDPNNDSLPIDCGKDDYYSTLCAIDKSRCPGPNSTAGSGVYLANSYNIAEHSLFLNPITFTPTDPITCFASTPTLMEEHSEFHIGSAANESVWADDGFDFMQGFTGVDYLCGSAGNDEVQGGGDADLIAGGGGADIVRGGTGNDTIRGNDHDDALYDGTGSDTIEGGEGYDTLYQCADSVSDSITGVENIVPASSSYC